MKNTWIPTVAPIRPPKPFILNNKPKEPTKVHLTRPKCVIWEAEGNYTMEDIRERLKLDKEHFDPNFVSFCIQRDHCDPQLTLRYDKEIAVEISDEDYQAALDEYEIRLERYHRIKKRYEQDMRSYNEKLLLYEENQLRLQQQKVATLREQLDQ